MGDADLRVDVAFVGASDVFADGPSAGVVDVVLGRPFGVEITVQNGGDADSDEVAITVSLEDAFALDGYSIDGEPADVTPALELSIPVGVVVAGTSTTVLLELTGIAYTADREMPATIAIDVNGVGETELATDIYSDRRFTWDGGRLEGWTSTASLAVDEDAGALTIESTSDPSHADSPVLDVPVAEILGMTLTASRDADS